MDMDKDRIADLLDPFHEKSLSSSQLGQISIYIDLLLRWNARINLTAIRNEDEIVTRHFGESLFLARHLFPASMNHCHPERSQGAREARVLAESKDPCPLPQPNQGIPTAPTNPPHVLDIGSGAGFPALPVKIWAPNIHLTMIESNHKKAAFLREVARALTLTNINVIAARAETLAARVGQDFPQAEAVTLRAVENFETILHQAVSFLAPHGSIALLIGSAQVPHLTALTTVEWCQAIPIPQSHSRVLSIGIHE